MIFNTTQLHIVAVTKYALVLKACQAIVEGSTKTITLLHADVLIQLKKLTDDFDNLNLYASQLDIWTVRESQFELLTIALKSAYASGKPI